MALPPSGLLTESISLSLAMLSFTARPRSLAIVDTRSTALMNSAFGDLHLLVVALRDDAAVIGERAVDQLRGQRHGADLEAHLGRADTPTFTAAALSSIRRCSSCTVFRGMMTPGMPSAPFGSGSSTCARRCPSVATARSIVFLPLSAVCR